MASEKIYKTIIVLLVGIIAVMAVVLLVRRPQKLAPAEHRILPVQKKAPAAKKAKIAIVIDDVGYNTENLSRMESMKFPLTFSILPGLSHSQDAARQLSAKGFQVILHLPMEPLEKMKLEDNTILVSMDDARIRSIIDQDLIELPLVKGVSNHMGSKVTADAATLGSILGEIKRKHLFFLDSFVTPNSVAKELAYKDNVAFVRRDVFLDNTADPGSIRRQLTVLKERATKNGAAVGIGHDRKTTLEVLRQALPELQNEGYRFVFVSELAQ